jgi:hypothetical protein
MLVVALLAGASLASVHSPDEAFDWSVDVSGIELDLATEEAIEKQWSVLPPAPMHDGESAPTVASRAPAWMHATMEHGGAGGAAVRADTALCLSGEFRPARFDETDGIEELIKYFNLGDGKTGEWRELLEDCRLPAVIVVLLALADHAFSHVAQTSSSSYSGRRRTRTLATTSRRPQRCSPRDSRAACRSSSRGRRCGGTITGLRLPRKGCYRRGRLQGPCDRVASGTERRSAMTSVVSTEFVGCRSTGVCNNATGWLSNMRR